MKVEKDGKKTIFKCGKGSAEKSVPKEKKETNSDAKEGGKEE